VGICVRVMERLGAKHVLVVYGRDSMDEVSSARPPWSAS
jgi:anthranilate phosphoribosyltransferase